MKKFFIIVLFILCPLVFGQQKKPVFFHQYNIADILAGGSVFIYEQGKDKIDSLRQVWEQNFSEIYLFTVVVDKKVIATVDSDLNFTLVDSMFDKAMLKNALFIQFLQMQNQKQSFEDENN